jgi:hypothetical protein
LCRGIAVVAACCIAISKAMIAFSRSAVERRMGFRGMELSSVDLKSFQSACLSYTFLGAERAGNS